MQPRKVVAISPHDKNNIGSYIQKDKKNSSFYKDCNLLTLKLV